MLLNKSEHIYILVLQDDEAENFEDLDFFACMDEAWMQIIGKRLDIIRQMNQFESKK